MKSYSLFKRMIGVFLSISCLPFFAKAQPSTPIQLHPDNPHYFLWQGKPTILITSAEHYGVLLNLDFDFRKYVDTLASEGMNMTRIFSGAYCEPDGAFNISRNTLAPAEGRFIAPWKRSETPGYANGGNKFDLNEWDPKYFERLRDLMGYAQEKGIVIEFTYFCPMYREMQWELSPMNARNNINGVGDIGRNDVYTLDRNSGLLAYQEALTRKLTEVLNPYDNVMLEIANEPYFGGVTMEWQHRIADIMIETEKELPKKHLITQNIANNKALIENPHPGISVFNFHYATPPDTVGMNYHLNKVIGDNETGFRGNADEPYRKEAWDFIIAGGALFNHLDYSFAVGFEDGTFAYPTTQPGGGNTGFRRQMRILSDFMHRFDFINMHPDNSVIQGGIPTGGTARALVQPGMAMAIYMVNEGATGPWSARWTGYIEALESGEFGFHTWSNDGVRLWVGDQLLIDNWTDHGETEDTGQLELKIGKQYPVKLEYYYNGGQGVTKLGWTLPSGKKESIPANAYRLPDKKGWGLRGQYFKTRDLTEEWKKRDDGVIDFKWGINPPFAGESTEEQTELEIKLDEGQWKAFWVDTLTGNVLKSQTLQGGGIRKLAAPPFKTDIALGLKRRVE